MELKIPRFVQKPRTCGPTTLREIFAFWEGRDTVSEAEILKEVPHGMAGVWDSSLGLYAIKRGYCVRLETYDINLIDPTWEKLSIPEIIKKLKRRLKFEKREVFSKGCESLIDYLEAGGEFKIRILALNDLRESIDRGVPPILAVSPSVIRKEKRTDLRDMSLSDMTGSPHGHFIIISGYKKGKFVIIDTNKNTKGRYEVPENELLFSWYFWGGTVLYIQKNSKLQ